MQVIEPVTLTGKHVRLEPLGMQHLNEIYEAGNHESIWTYMSRVIRSVEDATEFIEQALHAQRAGTDLPFAILSLETGKVIGSTRFMNISARDKRVEIGFTWLTPAVWKTTVNTECKWLLLRHCFEQLKLNRVEFKTDARNLNSQRAIARIGGVKEGVFRKHMIVRDGYVRDSVYFSIVDTDWPHVDQKLKMCLNGE